MEEPTILKKIKQRPGMYIGSRSIIKLKAFLDGYYFRGIESTLEQEEQMSFWKLFQSWIANKYGITSSHSWARIILFFPNDERDAFETFFQDLEDFKESSEPTNKVGTP